jgi:hypothetical protein
VNRGYATFIALLFLSLAILITTWLIVYRLAQDDNKGRHLLRWLSAWSLKGIFLPMTLWAMMNVGLSWNLQPFVPDIQFARNSGKPWGGTFLQFLGDGLFIVTSYWTALTLGWIIQKSFTGLEGQQRSDFKGLCFTCFLGLFLPAIGVAYLGGLPLLGFAVAAIVGPIAGYAPNILQARKTPPIYARAVARIKFGKYKEAEWEIIRELEKAQDDFEGWIMLAELYAKNFNDLAEAEQTVLEICDHPRTSPTQLSVALHRLSEWQLNLANDPEAASRALEMICNRLPGTHLAHMAQLRINQLPKNDEQLHELRNPRPIRLPQHHSELGADKNNMVSKLDNQQFVAAANACVEKLNKDRNDVSAREKLAHILAERLGQVDEGLEQLTLLLNLPDASNAKRAEWLSLAANWHLTYRQDLETGRKLFQRLLREFPQSPEAAQARQRIEINKTEI